MTPPPEIAESPDPLHHPARGGGLCEPGDGAGHRFAPPADRRRFRTTVGDASIVVAAYALSHGSIQLIIGPVGDRFGKYRTVTVMCALRRPCWWRSADCASRCRRWRWRACLRRGGRLDHSDSPWPMWATSPPTNAASRFSAATFRARSSASCSGRRPAACLATCFGWRNVFFVLAADVRAGDRGLIFELLTNPRTRAGRRADERSRGFIADYAAVLSNPLGAHRHPRRVHRGRYRLGRVRLCRAPICTCASG